MRVVKLYVNLDLQIWSGKKVKMMRRVLTAMDLMIKTEKLELEIAKGDYEDNRVARRIYRQEWELRTRIRDIVQQAIGVKID